MSHRPKFFRISLTTAILVFLIVAGGIMTGAWFFRSAIRDQILTRDVELLQSISTKIAKDSVTGGALDYLDVAMEASDLRGVIGIQVYNPPDTLIEQVPFTLYYQDLPSEQLQALRDDQPQVRFHEDLSLDVLFSDAPVDPELRTFPILELSVPIREQDGEQMVIRYWIDGTRIAREFALLDRNILLQTGLLILVTGLLVFGILAVAARRIRRLQESLARRNEDLEKANQALARTARTSAIGAITAHLFHDIKNPVAGLKQYLKTTNAGDEASNMANRIQNTITETLQVIRHGENLARVKYEDDEVLSLIKDHLEVFQEGASERVTFSRSGPFTLDAHTASLTAYILSNVIRNALEASGEEDNVEVTFNPDGRQLNAEVADHGPGLPDYVRDSLFEPGKSSKSGGAGLGLSISRELARSLGGTIELVSTGPSGTQFRITIPLFKESNENEKDT